MRAIRGLREFLNFMIKKQILLHARLKTDYEANKGVRIVSINLRHGILNFLIGSVSFLRLTKLRSEWGLEIIQKATAIGSMFHDSWTVIVWGLKNV
jgi:hypothetical protein